MYPSDMGTQPMAWSLLLPPSSLSCLIEKRKRRVDTDPEILTCCCSRTQASGFSQPLFPYSLPHAWEPGILVLPIPFVLTAKPPVLGSSYLGHLHPQLESQALQLGFQWSQLSLPGPQSDSRQFCTPALCINPGLWVLPRIQFS